MYEGKIKTNFHDNGMSKEGCHSIFLSVILIDFVCKVGKKYYCKCF